MAQLPKMISFFPRGPRSRSELEHTYLGIEDSQKHVRSLCCQRYQRALCFFLFLFAPHSSRPSPLYIYTYSTRLYSSRYTLGRGERRARRYYLQALHQDCIIVPAGSRFGTQLGAVFPIGWATYGRRGGVVRQRSDAKSERYSEKKKFTSTIYICMTEVCLAKKRNTLLPSFLPSSTQVKLTFKKNKNKDKNKNKNLQEGYQE